MKFAEKIRGLRTTKGLSQNAVAKAIGVSRRTYVSYEQEGRYPRYREQYAKLAEVLGCEPNYLILEDENFILDASERYGYNGRKQAENLVAQLAGMFAGGELDDQDKDAVMIALQHAYFDCKEDNKKYIPSKYHLEKKVDEDAE